MRKFRIISLMILYLCVSSAAYAAQKEVPPWMEDIDETGRSNYLVPKGAKRKIVGSQVIVEPPNEYVARRMYEMQNYLDGKFKNIEENQEKFQKDLEELKKEFEQLKADDTVTQSLDELSKRIDELQIKLDQKEEPAEVIEKTEEPPAVIEETNEPQETVESVDVQETQEIEKEEE